MQESVCLLNILNELKDIKEKIGRIENAVEELLDSTLTPEEEKLLKEVKEKIEKGNFSDFVPLDKLDEALE